MKIAILVVATMTAGFLDIEEREKMNINFQEEMNSATLDDANLKSVQIIEKYGYPVEDYYLTTHDGYVLNLHRIPHGKNGPSESRPTVFLMHGILASSADWIIAGPEKGFAYYLADKGYDVWLGNARGNRYSRNHTYLNLDGKEFWDFSWHEIGITDLPTMIDFALKKTGQKQLFYVGHSQGSTAFFVMTSERPEYNKKIRAQFSMAPVVFLSHMTSPLYRVLAFAEGGLAFLLKWIGVNEFMPASFMHYYARYFCVEGFLQPLCANSLFALCGFNKKQLNTTLLPILMAHTPAGSSTKQFEHYAQEINSGKFCQFDYGQSDNMKHYGGISPPNYDLNKVTAPVYLFYSLNDWLVAEIDVLELFKKLPNVQGKILISDHDWNHLDYLFGIDAVSLVYDHVYSLMRYY